MSSFRCMCIAALLVASVGCSTDRSAGIESDYESALSAEAERVSAPTPQPTSEVAEGPGGDGSDTLDEELDVHFGFALQRGAANKLIKRGLKAEFARALAETPGSITVAGQEIPLRLDTNLADVQLEADDSCPTCVRITGKLAGRELPCVGLDGLETADSE